MNDILSYPQKETLDDIGNEDTLVFNAEEHVESSYMEYDSKFDSKFVS